MKQVHDYASVKKAAEKVGNLKKKLEDIDSGTEETSRLLELATEKAYNLAVAVELGEATPAEAEHAEQSKRDLSDHLEGFKERRKIVTEAIYQATEALNAEEEKVRAQIHKAQVEKLSKAADKMLEAFIDAYNQAAELVSMDSEYGVVVRSFSGRNGRGNQGDVQVLSDSNAEYTKAGFIQPIEPLKKRKASTRFKFDQDIEGAKKEVFDLVKYTGNFIQNWQK